MGSESNTLKKVLFYNTTQQIELDSCLWNTASLETSSQMSPEKQETRI